MTDSQAALAQVREALEAGPTPGEWVCYDDSSDGKTNRIEIVAIGKTVARIYRSVQEQDLPNARLIAACSPANMAAILAHVEAQAAEIKRLRKLAMTTHLFEEAPCFLCGYNGPGYYQPEQHPCAALYHEAMEEQR